MIFLEEKDEPVFHHRVNKIAECGPVARIGNHAAEEIKIHHPRTHPEPVIVPAGKKLKLFGNGKIPDIPVNKNRDGFKGIGIIL